VADERAGQSRGPGRAGVSAGVGPTVEFAFGAAFMSIRAIPLRAGRDECLTVSDLLPTAAGRFWIADAAAGALKVYSQQGWRLKSLGCDATGLRRPVSLASLHGRWIAALDGAVPAVAILDESGRALRRFRLAELDRPAQVAVLGDRLLAVVGAGWGSGAGKQVHLYTVAGEYVESLFGEPRPARSSGRPFIAAAGNIVYLGHTRTDSFFIYDVKDHAVTSFSSVAARVAHRLGRAARFTPRLRGLFATACGPVLAAFKSGDDGYLYDLYSLEGKPIALGLVTGERVVNVEGRLFYSVRPSRSGDATLTVWRLTFDGNGMR
jgi:hypothetical protein